MLEPLDLCSLPFTKPLPGDGNGEKDLRRLSMHIELALPFGEVCKHSFRLHSTKTAVE